MSAEQPPAFRYQSLASLDRQQQIERGYGHTVAEIWQQPATWTVTARAEPLRAAIEKAVASSGLLESSLGGIVLTGSGSSQFVGDCLAMPLQAKLGLPVWSIPSGTLLTHFDAALPPVSAVEPLLFVSIARSGNSPESVAVAQLAMRRRPNAHHLMITCNAEGKLATEFSNRSQVHVALLEPRTNDRSLVMTSSFTNLLLAGSLLGSRCDPATWANRTECTARTAESVLQTASDAIANVAEMPFKSAIYLGSGNLFGAAREAALKLLEMTDGRVLSLPESFLGFRHGPMSATGAETLIVAMLSGDDTVRAYELDLLAELEQKQLGLHTLIAGFNVPKACASRRSTTTVEFVGEYGGETQLAMLHVLVGQLLGLFRCLKEGFKPDAPSASSVITRVVPPFRIHGLEQQ